MTEKELQKLIERAVEDKDLDTSDIPAIDLYSDQILSLVGERNATAAPRYRERQLTKTMINNYSKDGLIRPIEGKKYSREHIIEILLVWALKSTLSIGEIKRVLTGVRDENGISDEELTEGYERFLSFKETNRTRTREIVEHLVKEDGLDLKKELDFFAAILDIVSLSAYLKTVAQELLEAHYADPDAKEKERRELEKQQKKEQSDKEKQQKKEQSDKEKQQKKEQSDKEKQQKKQQSDKEKRDKQEQKLREKLARLPAAEESE